MCQSQEAWFWDTLNPQVIQHLGFTWWLFCASWLVDLVRSWCWRTRIKTEKLLSRTWWCREFSASTDYKNSSVACYGGMCCDSRGLDPLFQGLFQVTCPQNAIIKGTKTIDTQKTLLVLTCFGTCNLILGNAFLLLKHDISKTHCPGHRVCTFFAKRSCLKHGIQSKNQVRYW